MRFKVLPISETLADKVRLRRRAPGFGHAVEASVAGPDGYGPCRLCLRRTREGEGRLLFTYNPFTGPEDLPVAGPVFIHEGPCEAYSEPGFPEELRGLPLFLQGHLRGGAGLVNRRLEGLEPEAAIEALLADPDVDYVALRNAEAGCFIARVERVEGHGHGPE